jgi:TolA-binding protein
MTPATCREVEAAFAREGADPARTPALDRHRDGCATCLARARAQAAIRASILDANDVLDDATRARVRARLLASPDLQTRSTSPGTRGILRPILGTLALAAAVALIVSAGIRGKRAAPSVASSPLASLVALEPYDATANGAIPRGPLDRLELPARSSVRARLGEIAELVLGGPLALVVRDAAHARVELELSRGTLVGDFDGTRGRSLRIATADATIDIVGTRFLVEASPARTRVSVDHGRVRVESRGRVQTLAAGRSWATDSPAPEPSDARVAEIFARAARGDLAAPDAGPAPVTAPPPAKPQKRVGPPAHDRRLAANFHSGAEAPARQTVPSPGPDAKRPVVALRAEKEGPSPAPPEARPPDTAPPAPVAPAPATARPTPALRPTTLYQQAESAFSRGDDAKGQQLLNDLVRTFPDATMADSARFELALRAEKAGKPNEAMAATREILRDGAKGPFVEPARLLRCRLHLADDKDNAALCLERFVRDYPRSPHDDFALRTLTELARDAGRCADAAKLADLYLQRHPQGAFAAEAGRIRSRCAE